MKRRIPYKQLYNAAMAVLCDQSFSTKMESRYQYQALTKLMADYGLACPCGYPGEELHKSACARTAHAGGTMFVYQRGDITVSKGATMRAVTDKQTT